MKAPPPFCFVIPPLPSFAHIALPFGGKIPVGTSWIWTRELYWKSRNLQHTLEGFSSMFFLVLFRYVHVLMDHGMVTDVLLWIIRTVVSSDIQHDTNVDADVVLDTLNFPKYVVYPWIATLFTLKLMCCCYKWYLVALSQVAGNVVTRSCVNCYGGWKGKVYGGFIVVSFSIIALCQTLY